MKVSRVHRLLKLISVLRSGRSFDADALAVEIGVSRRTFFRDMQLLEKAGVPCRFEHQRNEYRISDEFFLPPVHLDLQEAMALLLVTRKFINRQTHPAYQKALDAAMKIESTLPRPVLEHCGAWLDGITFKTHSVSPADTTPKQFQMIQFALADRQRIRVRYDSVYDRGEIEVELEPLRLLFISRGWYLIAHSLMHQEHRTFKLDRMLEVTLTETHYTPDPNFDESKHFGAAWLMIPEGRLYDVQLRFSSEAAASIEEVHWHASQETSRLPDGRLDFEVRVDGLKEIAAWVLSYGDQVEVLAPPELRSMIREKAQRVVALADGVQAGAA